MHILQGDLILHKRTLEPIKTVIYGLRRYDVDRVLALRENTDGNTKVEGYMSHKSKIYLVRFFPRLRLPAPPAVSSLWVTMLMRLRFYPFGVFLGHLL